MTVRIVTDSSSDLTSEITNKLGIAVVPFHIHFGDEVYRDGVDITIEEFYQKLTRTETLPFTAAPSPGTFAEVYDKLAEETDKVLAIIISSKYSVAYEAAIKGRELRNSKCRVEIIDSLFATLPLGLIVIAAAKAAQAGANLDEIVNATRSNILRTDVRMAFDTLEYLRKGGRIGTAQAFLGSILKIHPILTIRNGHTEGVARERSRAKAIEHLYNFAMSFSRIDEMLIGDATTPDEADMLAERLNSKFPKERIYRSKVGATVGTHVGPHILELAVLGDRG